MKTKLWRLIIEKLFCKHQWTGHAMTQRPACEHVDWHDTPKFYVITTEVLKCTICGKIKNIKY